MLKSKVDRAQAEQSLKSAGGHVRKAISLAKST